MERKESDDRSRNWLAVVLARPAASVRRDLHALGRRLEREASKIPLFDVPNSLQEKVTGTWDPSRFDRTIKSAIGDLSARKGEVQGMTTDRGVAEIDAVVPLRRMFGYSTDLRSLTQGRATYTMQFSHYAQVPEQVARGIVFN